MSFGGIKKAFFKEGFQEYLKKIGHYAPVEAIDIKEETFHRKAGKAEILRKEAEKIEKRLKPGDYLVALAENGKGFSSAGFAKFIEGRMVKGEKSLVFVTGGPFGLHESILSRADAVLSLSDMTLPHELARLVLAEQVYRAFTIIKGEPYSH